MCYIDSYRLGAKVVIFKLQQEINRKMIQHQISNRPTFIAHPRLACGGGGELPSLVAVLLVEVLPRCYWAGSSRD